MNVDMQISMITRTIVGWKSTRRRARYLRKHNKSLRSSHWRYVKNNGRLGTRPWTRREFSTQNLFHIFIHSDVSALYNYRCRITNGRQYRFRPQFPAQTTPFAYFRTPMCGVRIIRLLNKFMFFFKVYRTNLF